MSPSQQLYFIYLLLLAFFDVFFVVFLFKNLRKNGSQLFVVETINAQ